jgi:hypothetical protein
MPDVKGMPDAARQFAGWMLHTIERETVFLYRNPISDLRNNSVVSMLMLRQRYGKVLDTVKLFCYCSGTSISLLVLFMRRALRHAEYRIRG